MYGQISNLLHRGAPRAPEESPVVLVCFASLHIDMIDTCTHVLDLLSQKRCL